MLFVARSTSKSGDRKTVCCLPSQGVFIRSFFVFHGAVDGFHDLWGTRGCFGAAVGVVHLDGGAFDPNLYWNHTFQASILANSRSMGLSGEVYKFSY